MIVDAARFGALRKGLTLIEITVALLVFAGAMIPILSLTFTSARQTFSLEKHLIAGQVASGLMDRFLAMGFDECREKAARESSPRKVLDDVPPGILAGTGSATADLLADLQRSLADFTFAVQIREPGSEAEGKEMFTLVLTVSWPAAPGSLSRRFFSLKAVKFNEEP